MLLPYRSLSAAVGHTLVALTVCLLAAGCGPSPYDDVAQNTPAAAPAADVPAPADDPPSSVAPSPAATGNPTRVQAIDPEPDAAAEPPDSSPTGPASRPAAPPLGGPANPPPATGPPPAQNPPPGGQSPAAPTSSQPAQAGSGRRGRSLDNINDPVGKVIAEPARAYFQLREKATFEIAIPKALQLYHAFNGKPPANHDVFMKEIIEANRLRLPDLYPNQRYRFDPTRGQYGELMVDKMQ